jgi:hypothetical protein
MYFWPYLDSGDATVYFSTGNWNQEIGIQNETLNLTDSLSNIYDENQGISCL